MTSTLAPIVDLRYIAMRSGRREQWSARTADGRWLFEREDTAGTPWSVFALPAGLLAGIPTPYWWGYVGSLERARCAAADGTLDTVLGFDLARALHALLLGGPR